MAEILEYTLALSVSMLFVAASVTTYEEFEGVETHSVDEAAYSSVITLARIALAEGSASSYFSLPNSTITCQAGTMDFTSAGSTLSDYLGAPCSFAISITSGAHELVFSERSGVLMLVVS